MSSTNTEPPEPSEPGRIGRCCQFLTQNKKKIFRTLLLTFALLCYGLQSDILGPALPTFMQQTETNFQHISTVLSCKALGLVVGALTGGILGNYFNRHRYLIICLMLTLSSFVFLVFPFVNDIGVMIFFMALLGYLHVNILMNCNVLLGRLWDGHSGPAFNFMHTGHSLGGVFAALIVRPFIMVDDSKSSSQDQQQARLKNGTRPVKILGPLINDLPPFSILACLALIGALLFLLVWFLQNIKRTSKALQKNPKADPSVVACPMKPEPEKSLLNELKQVHTSRNFEKGIVAILPIATFFIISAEKVFANFSVSYLSSNNIGLTENDVLMLNTLYWLLFTVGRVLFTIITSFVSVKIILLLSSQVTFFIMLGFSFIIGGKANNYAVVVFYGLFSGGLIPCLIGSVNSVMHITGLVAMFLELGTAAGVLIMNNVTGVAMSDLGVQSFVYILASLHGFNLLVALILVLLIEMLTKNRKDPEVQLVLNEEPKSLSYDSINGNKAFDLPEPENDKTRELS